MPIKINTWEDYKTEFQGEEVTMKVRKLKRWAFMELLPHMTQAENAHVNLQKHNQTGEGDAIGVIIDAATAMNALQEVGETIFAEHVKDIHGIEVDDKPITPDQLCTESCFKALATDIIMHLSAISTLMSESEKNSGRLSGTSAEDSTRD